MPGARRLHLPPMLRSGSRGHRGVPVGLRFPGRGPRVGPPQAARVRRAPLQADLRLRAIRERGRRAHRQPRIRAVDASARRSSHPGRRRHAGPRDPHRALRRRARQSVRVEPDVGASRDHPSGRRRGDRTATERPGVARAARRDHGPRHPARARRPLPLRRRSKQWPPARSRFSAPPVRALHRLGGREIRDGDIGDWALETEALETAEAPAP